MRRAVFGTMAACVAGAAGVFAQAPTAPMHSPYSHYSPQSPRYGYRADGPAYGPVAPPRSAPSHVMPPTDAVPTTYGPTAGPTYGPVGQLVPVGGQSETYPGTPIPAPTPVNPAPMPTHPGPAVNPGGPINYGPAYGQLYPHRGNPYGVGPQWNQAGAPWGNPGWNGCVDNCWDGNCYTNCGPCPNGVCGPEGKMWINAEMLLWWAKGQYLPPLVTRGTGLVNPGVLGQPGTQIVFGNNTVGDYMRPGFRTRVGAWIDQCQNIGIEGSFAFLGIADDFFRTNCRVGDVISRPFFNVDPGVNAEDAELVCVPGVLCGDVSVATRTEFYIADANVRRNLCCSCDYRIDVLGGFRYAHLGDSVNITENLTNLDPGRGVVGEGFIVNDQFHTRNDFYGGQVGVAGEFRSGKAYLDWRALVAFGSSVRTVEILGSTTFLDPVPGGNPVRQPGGLLALPSNIGTYTSASFAVIPEANLNLGYQVSPMLRAYVGYSFLYWNNVARAGEQIDLNVDPNGLPTRIGPGVIGTAPNFTLRLNDFWIHGINFGAQLRW